MVVAAVATTMGWTLGPSGALGQPVIAALDQLAPLRDGTPAAWVRAGLPGQGQAGAVPLTQLDVLPQAMPDVAARPEGPVLRLRTQASYGNLVHALHPPWVPVASATLRWRWRLDQPLTGADLTRKSGDDVAVKLCVLFDLPLARVPFVERQLLRLARQRTGQDLPAATVCYVWDNSLSAGQRLPNAYSRRVRQVVLEGAGAPRGQWREARVQPYADFVALFGDELPDSVPAITAVAIGADADNTGSSSLAWVADVRWGAAAD